MKTQPKNLFCIIWFSIYFVFIALFDRYESNANFFAAYFFKKSKKNEVKSHEIIITKILLHILLL